MMKGMLAIIVACLLAHSALSKDVSGQVANNTVWTVAESPYYVIDNTIVLSGNRLFIDAGVTIIIDGKSLMIQGGIFAHGTTSNRITFDATISPNSGSEITFGTEIIGARWDADGNYLEGSILEGVDFLFQSSTGGTQNGVVQIPGPGVPYLKDVEFFGTGSHDMAISTSSLADVSASDGEVFWDNVRVGECVSTVMYFERLIRAIHLRNSQLSNFGGHGVHINRLDRVFSFTDSVMDGNHIGQYGIVISNSYAPGDLVVERSTVKNMGNDAIRVVLRSCNRPGSITVVNSTLTDNAGAGLRMYTFWEDTGGGGAWVRVCYPSYYSWNWGCDKRSDHLIFSGNNVTHNGYGGAFFGYDRHHWCADSTGTYYGYEIRGLVQAYNILIEDNIFANNHNPYGALSGSNTYARASALEFSGRAVSSLYIRNNQLYNNTGLTSTLYLSWRDYTPTNIPWEVAFNRLFDNTISNSVPAVVGINGVGDTHLIVNNSIVPRSGDYALYVHTTPSLPEYELAPNWWGSTSAGDVVPGLFYEWTQNAGLGKLYVRSMLECDPTISQPCDVIVIETTADMVTSGVLGGYVYNIQPTPLIPASASPVIVEGNLLITTGATLIIEPGVVMQFRSGRVLEVRGTLSAQGTSTERIIFTAADNQVAGEYAGILFADGCVDGVRNSTTGEYISGSILSHTQIQYGGGGDASIMVSRSAPYLSHITITESAGHGVHLSDQNVPIVLNDIIVWGVGTTDGIHVSSGSQPITFQDIQVRHVNRDGIRLDWIYQRMIFRNVLTANNAGSGVRVVYCRDACVIDMDEVESKENTEHGSLIRFWSCGGGGDCCHSGDGLEIVNSIFSNNQKWGLMIQHEFDWTDGTSGNTGCATTWDCCWSSYYNIEYRAVESLVVAHNQIHLNYGGGLMIGSTHVEQIRTDPAVYATFYRMPAHNLVVESNEIIGNENPHSSTDAASYYAQATGLQVVARVRDVYQVIHNTIMCQHATSTAIVFMSNEYDSTDPPYAEIMPNFTNNTVRYNVGGVTGGGRKDTMIAHGNIRVGPNNVLNNIDNYIELFNNNLGYDFQLDARDNYWGGELPSARVFDLTDDVSYGVVLYDRELASASPFNPGMSLDCSCFNHFNSCVSCAYGSGCSDSECSNCTDCIAGTFSDGGTSTCSSCSPGYYSFNAASRCNECDAGYYAGNVGASFCLPCDPGYVSESTGSSSCHACLRGSSAPNGSSSCDLCDHGEYAPITGSPSCLKCPEGYFGNGTGLIDCTPCPTGKYAPLDGLPLCWDCFPGEATSLEGQSNCTKCSPGKESPVPGATACIDCEAGKYAPVAGIASCLACPTGQYSGKLRENTLKNDTDPGASECIDCPAGTYSNDPNGAVACVPCPETMLSNEGSSKCSQCPAGSAASKNALSIRDCICVYGYYGKEGDCSPCPEGAFCLGGSEIPDYPIAGYWSDGLSDAFLSCPAGEDACLEGGGCANGYEGRMCAKCTDKYWKSDNVHCASCPSSPGGFVVLVVLLLMVFSFGLYIMAGRTGKRHSRYTSVSISRWTAIGVGFHNFQMIGLNINLGIRWPISLVKLFNALNLSIGLDLSIMRPECNGMANYNMRWGISLLLPLIMMVILVLDYWLIRLYVALMNTRYTMHWGMADGSKFVGRAQRFLHVSSFTKAEKKVVKHRFQRGYLILLSLVQLPLATMALQYWDCTRLADGIWTLDAEPSVICWEGDHLRWLGVAIVVVVVYALGLPLLFRFLLYYKRRTHSQEKYLKRYGLFVAAFKTKYYWWAVMIMYVKLSYSAAVLFASASPVFEAAVAQGVLVIALMYQFKYTPYIQPRHNTLALLCLGTAYLTLFFGVLYHLSVTGEAVHELRYVAEYALWCLMGIAFLAIVFNAVVDMLQFSGKFRLQLRKKREGKLRRVSMRVANLLPGEHPENWDDPDDLGSSGNLGEKVTETETELAAVTMDSTSESMMMSSAPPRERKKGPPPRRAVSMIAERPVRGGALPHVPSKPKSAKTDRIVSMYVGAPPSVPAKPMRSISMVGGPPTRPSRPDGSQL